MTILKSIISYMCLAACVVAFPSKLLGQEVNDFENLFEENKHHHSYSHELKNNDNEIEFMLSVFFVFYKQCISSQDGGRCNFVPSCSAYAVSSIKSRGLFIGTLSAFDRLSRCNPKHGKQYEYNKDLNKWIDK